MSRQECRLHTSLQTGKRNSVLDIQGFFTNNRATKFKAIISQWPTILKLNVPFYLILEFFHMFCNIYDIALSWTPPLLGTSVPVVHTLKSNFTQVWLHWKQVLKRRQKNMSLSRCPSWCHWKMAQLLRDRQRENILVVFVVFKKKMGGESRHAKWTKALSSLFISLENGKCCSELLCVRATGHVQAWETE